MFERILVALDGGRASRCALHKAIDIARSANAKVTAVFVLDHHLTAVDVLRDISEERIFRLFMHEEAENELRYARKMFSSNGVKGRTSMIDTSGESVADAICRAAITEEADLVVIGHREPTAFQKIFGSVTSKVMKKSDALVLLVSEGEEDHTRAGHNVSDGR
ncbi:universal stress protein [Burkholderia sp. WTPI3]|uniref:universal stress protein n=1 Tax=Burkholderia sp. WTPI3 TaxID=2822167 RepID=UPI001F2A45A2|nr:universal stress protein [Burkholderia sp. WTPI3]